MQVDVAGGGTVTYVDDTLFPIAKVIVRKLVQQCRCVPSVQAAAIHSKVHCQGRADLLLGQHCSLRWLRRMQLMPESVMLVWHLTLASVSCRTSGEESCTWPPMLYVCHTGKTPCKNYTACTCLSVAFRAFQRCSESDLVVLPCRHLNADEYQFVANGSNIEIGNFLQDGAKRSLPVDTVQARWPRTASLLMQLSAMLKGLPRTQWALFRRSCCAPVQHSIPTRNMQALVGQHLIKCLTIFLEVRVQRSTVLQSGHQIEVYTQAPWQSTHTNPAM